MHRKLTSRPLRLIAVLASALALLVVAGALAAHPKHGKTYSGTTSEAKVNGHRAPVSFKVSSNGGKLLDVRYGTIGCIPGGTPTGNPYTMAGSKIKIGTVPVSSTGSFSVTHVASTYTNVMTNVTTSALSGSFKTATKATGKITYSQSLTGPGGFSKSCGPVHLTFSATTP